MALTKETITANATLAGLSEEQINAITTLSKNDEDVVIGKRFGEVYGAIDADVLSVSGVEKNGTEKTYDYVKRVLGQFKDQAGAAAGMQKQIDTLNSEKARLEKAISEGAADKETAKQLKQAKTDLANLTKQYTELNSKYEKANDDHAKELFGIKVDTEMRSALTGIKFKKDLPEAVTKVITEQVLAKVKGMSSGYEDNGEGGQFLAFRDAEGGLLRNVANLNKPYTAAELIEKELKAMDVLEKTRQQGGSGSGSQGGNVGAASIGSARTQTEAYDILANGFMAQGLVKGSAEFENKMNEAWKENNVNKLPFE